MTITEITTLIALKFADFTNITPAEHREVEMALLNYVAALPKVKVLTLDSIPSVDRNYSLATELPVGAIITSAVAMLECKIANNGFSIGDTVTTPTPYPADNGRTAEQGIGLQYSNVNPDSIKAMISDGVTIMTPYSAAPNAIANFMGISGTISNWKLKVVVNYI